MLASHRSDIRAKALRTAAKVALLGAAVGCRGTQAPANPSPAGAADPEVRTEPGLADAGPRVEAGAVVVGDAGVIPDAFPRARVTSDAGVEMCQRDVLSPADYTACCRRLGWDWKRGCMAWGPPAPPSVPRSSDLA